MGLDLRRKGPSPGVCSGWGSGGGRWSQYDGTTFTLLCSSACPRGTYKALAGNGPCSLCPARSHTPDLAAPVCPCLDGFYRASSDPPEAPCTGESPMCPRRGNGTGSGDREGEPVGHTVGLVCVCSDFSFSCVLGSFLATLNLPLADPMPTWPASCPSPSTCLFCPLAPRWALSPPLWVSTFPGLPPSSITPTHNSLSCGPFHCPVASPGPPSAPRELWFEVQGSALMLHWRLPQELGGRGDLLFNVVCKECRGHQEPGSGGACHRCRDEVHFDPRQRGLTESRVLVGGLRAHVPYILEVQAVNGVSELSPDPPQAAAINVSTSHAGEPYPSLAPPPCSRSLALETSPLTPLPQFPPQSLWYTR